MRELPSSWSKISLGELTEITKPIAYGVLKPGPFVDGGIPLLRITDIKEDRVDESDVYKISVKLDEEFKRTRLEGGEVLISIQGTIGKVAICPPSLKGANISRTLARIVPGDFMLNKFLRYQLMFFAKSNLFDVRGATRASLNIGTIRETKVELPPIAEQKRIVEKLDVLFGELEVLKERLSNIPELLKSFRQAVLTQAVTGKLTAEWRVGKDLGEWEEIIDDLNSFSGKKITAKSILENGLLNVTVGDISSKVSVGHVGKTSEYYTESENGIPFLRSQNVKPGRLVLEGVAKITREFHDKLKKSQLEAGDLLIVRVGANRGDSTILPEGLGEINCANIVFARPYLKFSEYLKLYFQSSLWLNLIEELSTGTAQGVINTKIVDKVDLTIPLPKEQEEIVRRVEVLFEQVGAIETKYKALKDFIIELPQAILAKAFRGELVEQLPTDGDAKELLEEIKALKQQLALEKKNARKKSRVR